jgi:hypothetical protein
VHPFTEWLVRGLLGNRNFYIFWETKVPRIRIKQSAEDSIEETLFKYGIHRRTLFPDLEGLSQWPRRLKFDLPPN